MFALQEDAIATAPDKIIPQAKSPTGCLVIMFVHLKKLDKWSVEHGGAGRATDDEDDGDEDDEDMDDADDISSARGAGLLNGTATGFTDFSTGVGGL